jgi:hypothetical protein
LKERVTIIQLTGRGSYASAEERVRNATGNKQVSSIGDIVFLGDSSVKEAYRASKLPGVEWTASGYMLEGKDIIKEAMELASNFLREKKKFFIVAKEELSDIKMDIEGKILSSMVGKRIDGKKPDVTFVISKAGKRYAFGVKLYEGVGGCMQSSSKVACLVSGGMHSSVVSWLLCLSGKGLKIVHSFVNTFSLYSVAKLYEKLSSMSDPTLLELRVLKGEGQTEDILFSWIEDNNVEQFSGNHIECSEELFSEKIKAGAYTMPEEQYRKYLNYLRLKPFEKRICKNGRRVPYKELKFGGVYANMHEIIDSLSSSQV